MNYMSPGMRQAWLSGRQLRNRSACESCGLVVPVYPGQYPKRCTLCQATEPLSESILPREIPIPPPGAMRPTNYAYGLKDTKRFDVSGFNVLDAVDVYPRRAFPEPAHPPRHLLIGDLHKKMLKEAAAQVLAGHPLREAALKLSEMTTSAGVALPLTNVLLGAQNRQFLLNQKRKQLNGY